jgi:hypothetical protein
MNPSARGWINKLLKSLDTSNSKIELEKVYFDLRVAGFLYGSNLLIINESIDDSDFTQEERCKINLLLALLHTYNTETSNNNFIDSVIKFYTEINEHKTSVFSDILGGKIASATLERILHKRIQIDNNVITKNFNYFITNALLFVDVLAYQQYLKQGNISEDYIKHIEANLETVVINVLNAKQERTEYDNSLIKLLESSLRYHDHKSKSYQEAINSVKSDLEAHYLLDIACMSTWSDQVIDTNERSFLHQLGNDLKFEKAVVNDAINSVNEFYTKHKDNIALLSSKNLVKSFYDNSSKMVSKLISRNSKRLYKELRESKELVKLISQSTKRDLNEEEQKKVQEQLLDLFKSIPSLAIFMLPGGALLLPLFIKFIPKLLPSAFDENRIDED